MRPELAPLPERMKSLPIDERGYPIPWFVDYIDGKPEFRAMDSRKWVRAVRDRLCWVCGAPTGVNLAFVSGPMCGINRTSSEPPSHYDCAKWSALNCPFLNNPEQARRHDELLNDGTLRDHTAGMVISRNPGVTMLWVCRDFEWYRVRRNGPGNEGVLITMGEPRRVEWYREARAATRAEVIDSIDTGFINLKIMAEQEGSDAVAELQRARARFDKWLPAE